MRHLHRGFTLVELVVVIVVLGVLAAFAIPRFANFSDSAERAVVEQFVGAVASARSLAFASMKVNGVDGYTTPADISLYNLTRCDEVEALAPLTADGRGHYIALGSIRPNVFRSPSQSACSGNQIQFTSKSGRTITIVGGSAITWTASPAY